MNTSSKKDLRRNINNLENEIHTLESKLTCKRSELSRIKSEYKKIYGLIYLCRICGEPHKDQDFAENYNDLLVCDKCASRAVTENGAEPLHDSGSDDGDNPLFIDGIKVWRRYKFGGYITLFDEHNCEDVMGFYHRHFGL